MVLGLFADSPQALEYMVSCPISTGGNPWQSAQLFYSSSTGTQLVLSSVVSWLLSTTAEWKECSCTAAASAGTVVVAPERWRSVWLSHGWILNHAVLQGSTTSTASEGSWHGPLPLLLLGHFRGPHGALLISSCTG
jgi:hypothetical protein